MHCNQAILQRIVFFVHLTSTCNVVTVAKVFHSSSGNESHITNAGIMWNCVMAFGIRSTDVFFLRTLIDILKQKIKTRHLYLDDDCGSKSSIKFLSASLPSLIQYTTYLCILQMFQLRNSHSLMMTWNHRHTGSRSCHLCWSTSYSLHMAQCHQDNPHQQHIHLDLN